jgi:HEAT repeat protein
MPPHPGPEPFEQMLTGGHPNSLGRTLEVVALVLDHPARLEELVDGYRSEDAVVRLRVSNALKRICIEHPEWVHPFTGRLLGEISQIDQASTQWTLAILFRLMSPLLSPEEREQALAILQNNLDGHSDWIVLNSTMETLFGWAGEDAELREWLLPRLQRHAQSERKAVAGRASRYLKQLGSR